MVQTQLANKNYLGTSFTTRAKYSRLTQKINVTTAKVTQPPMNFLSNTNLSSLINPQEQFERTVGSYVAERIKLSLPGVAKSTSIAVCCLSLSISDELAQHWQQEKIDALQKIALQRLHRCLGSKSKIIQLAEGYFALILPYVTHLTEALNLVRVAQQELSHSFSLDQEIWHFRPYLGMSYCPHRAVKIELLLESAKQALERAQQDSEDCCVVYCPDSSSGKLVKLTSNLVELTRHQE